MRSPCYLICLMILFPEIRGQLPSFIKPCNLKSDDFIKCAVKSANEAIPSMLGGVKEFDVPSFTPLRIPLVEFSSGSLNLNGTEIVLTGIPDFVATNFLFDREKREMGIDLANPLLELNFKINIDGKIASLRIEGSGPAKIIIHNATYAYRISYDTTEKNGKTYGTIVKDDFVLKPSKVFFQFDNLFSGNKLLGDNLNKFLNENWPDVLEELNPVVKEIVGSIVKRMVLNLFTKVPFEEIFLGY